MYNVTNKRFSEVGVGWGTTVFFGCRMYGGGLALGFEMGFRTSRKVNSNDNALQFIR